MTEKQIRKKLVDTAISFLGCNESDGSHKKIIDIYNGHKPLARSYAVKYTDAWCATFVSAMSIKCGFTDILPTECGCQQQIERFKKLGAFVESDYYVPNVGDVVFYDWQDRGTGDNVGYADHVGIVVSVSTSSNTMRIIEGNYKNAVGYRNIAINGKFIRGFGVPNYAAKATKNDGKSAVDLANEVLQGKWGNGVERKRRLEAAGYDYDVVQSAVNSLLCASKRKSVDEIAREVIAGEWGNGETRKANLTAAGHDYDAVQKRVNELLKG